MLRLAAFDQIGAGHQNIIIASCSTRQGEILEKYMRPNLAAALLKSASRAALVFLLGLAPHFSWAYVECTVAPTQIYVDDGILWINFNNGGAGIAPLSDPAMKFYYASALTAYATGKNLIVRYPDGNACTAFNVAMIGLWIK